MVFEWKRVEEKKRGEFMTGIEISKYSRINCFRCGRTKYEENYKIGYEEQHVVGLPRPVLIAICGDCKEVNKFGFVYQSIGRRLKEEKKMDEEKIVVKFVKQKMGYYEKTKETCVICDHIRHNCINHINQMMCTINPGCWFSVSENGSCNEFTEK